MTSQPINLDRLLKAIRGGDTEISRGQAFALLARGPYPQQEDLLGTVLQDRRESLTMRSAAAIALGRIPTADSEQVLLANLRTGEPRVQAEVLRALGHIGGPEALAAIDVLRLSSENRSKEVAAFSAALIAHRLSLEGHELPLPPEEQLLVVGRAQSVPISSLPSDEAAKVIADLARQPYGIEYDPEKLVRLECRGRVNVVCPNRELSTPGGLPRLAQQNTLAGVVSLKSPETGDYSVSYVLMTSPSTPSGRVNIVAPRCSGRPGLAGTGNIVDDRLEFQLRSVERPGAFPIELAGEVSHTGVRFHHSAISLEQVPPRVPELRRLSQEA